MLFMNRWEIQNNADRFADHPVLGPATRTLRNLMEWTDSHSDGWAYWPKPCRAAKALQTLIYNNLPPNEWDEPTATVEQYKAALRPIKSFRTRQGADFTIVEA